MVRMSASRRSVSSAAKSFISEKGVFLGGRSTVSPKNVMFRYFQRVLIRQELHCYHFCPTRDCVSPYVELDIVFERRTCDIASIHIPLHQCASPYVLLRCFYE